MSVFESGIVAPCALYLAYISPISRLYLAYISQVSVFESGMVAPVCKAIEAAEMGFVPEVQGRYRGDIGEM